MGLADDFLQLPNGLKLLVGFVILLGASIKFPIIDLSIGQIIFSPFTFAFGFLGISFTWELFVVLYGLGLVLMFALWILPILIAIVPSNRSKR